MFKALYQTAAGFESFGSVRESQQPQVSQVARFSEAFLQKPAVTANRGLM